MPPGRCFTPDCESPAGGQAHPTWAEPLPGEEAVATDSSARDKLRSMAEQLMRNISDDLPEWIVFFREYNTLTGSKRKEVMGRREHYEALQSARQHQTTDEFRQRYAGRSGIEGTHAQAIRRCGQRVADILGWPRSACGT